MANISQVYLLDTPLEDDLKHTLYFSNLNAQHSYMSNNVIRSYGNVSYQRDTSTFRCPAHIDSIRQCNYMMYQNSAYSNKWFYCFIEKMTYISDGLTDVEFKVDPIQTFMFDFDTQPSFIEREHTNDDTVGNNTLPENLELGEYIHNSNVATQLIGTNTMWYAVGVSELVGNLSPKPKSSINGLPNGLFYIFADTMSKLHSIAEIYDDAGKGDAIYTMFVFPKDCLYIRQGGSAQWGYTNASWQYNGKTLHTTFDCFVPRDMGDVPGMLVENYTIPKPTRVGMSYTPRNKKLLTYPYCFFNISNNAGTSVSYHYEDFKGNPTFNLEGVLSVGCSTKLYPKNYKNMNLNGNNTFDYGLTGAKFPTISWNSDSYTNWITQNSVDVGIGIASTALATAGNLALGNVVGATASGIGGITGALTQFYRASMIPDQAKGSTNCGDINYVKNKNKFTVYPMSVKPEYAQIIDGYFDMFGYKTCRVKKPNYAHRQNWWYTKTIDIYIKGNIPNEYMTEIKDAYNNGITYWRNPSNFMNYSVSNGIV